LENHKLLIEHAYAATNTELEEAKRAYREARDAGDVDAELAASGVLSDARDKMRQLTVNYNEIVKRLETPPKPVQQQKTAAPAADDVERVISENFPNPKDQAWLRAHKGDIFGNGNEHRRELAVHLDKTARLKGIEAGSDAYYAYMDREMGYEEAPKQTPAPRQSKPVAPRAAAPAPVAPPAPEPVAAPVQEKRKAPLPGAPVSRSNGGAAGAAERASPEIKALAADLGMTVSEYLANDRLIREGKTHFRYT
jgi:hypothetical protein